MSLHRYIQYSGASTFAQAMAGGAGDGVAYISAADSEPLIVGSVAGLSYSALESFLSFDTTAVLNTPDIATLTLALTLLPDIATADFIVATYDWGASIAAGDWRNATALTALIEVGRFTYAGIAGLSPNDTFDVDIDPTGIVVGGTTRLIMFTENMAAPITTPTANQQLILQGDDDIAPALAFATAAPITEGPTVRLVTSRALAVPHQVQRWVLPIICKRFANIGPDDAIEAQQDVSAVREFFLGLRRSGTPVTFQEGTKRHLVVVRDVSFPDGMVEQWGNERDGMEGLLFVTVESTEA